MDQIEKELIGEIIQLNENPQVLSSTSINITWKLFKPSSLLEGYYIKYKPVGSSEYQTETVSNTHRRNNYVLGGLKKFTTYEIMIEPYRGHLRASESNVIQAKTREDVPSHSPVGLQINMDSLTSILIKWQPPPQEHMNGIILGYKVNCLTNETRFNLNLNTNASTRAIILGNLIENMSYCIKVAGYTRIGIGPYTRLECVEMTAAALAVATQARNNLVNHQKQDTSSASTLLASKTWLVALITLAFVSVLVLVGLVIRFVRRRRRSHRCNGGGKHGSELMRRKSSSSSSSKKSGFVLASENFTLLNKSANALIQSKFGETNTSGLPNQYKMVNDTIWLDTLNSFGNRSQHEFTNSATAAAIAGKYITVFIYIK